MGRCTSATRRYLSATLPTAKSAAQFISLRQDRLTIHSPHLQGDGCLSDKAYHSSSIPELWTLTSLSHALLASSVDPSRRSSWVRSVQVCGALNWIESPFASWLHTQQSMRLIPLVADSRGSPAGRLCPAATILPRPCPTGHVVSCTSSVRIIAPRVCL